MSRTDQSGPITSSQSEVSGTPQRATRRLLRSRPPIGRPTMPKQTPARSLFHRAGARLDEAEHVIDAMVVILSTVAAGIGLSMLWVPQAYYSASSLRVALNFLPPHVWGGALLLAGGATIVALRADRLTLAFALGAQVIIWGMWGVCLIIGVRDGVPSGAIVYTGLAWACFILAAYYWRKHDREVTHAP